MKAIERYLPFIFGFIKSFITNTKHNKKIKNYDKTKEKLETIEHMLVKLEKKLGDTRNELENLRKEIMFSRLMNLVLFILVIFLFFFFYIR
jgi:Fe2+ transport system protein B